MKNLQKLQLEEFKQFNLVSSDMKSLRGGGTPTQRNNTGDSSGPDWIFEDCDDDDCTSNTVFSNGTSGNDTIC